MLCVSTVDTEARQSFWHDNVQDRSRVVVRSLPELIGSYNYYSDDSDSNSIQSDERKLRVLVKWG